MVFNLSHSIRILERTPQILFMMLNDLPTGWVTANEGHETWSAFDILGHLIEGEKTDWIPRMNIILSDKEEKVFQPFDRFVQLKENKGKSLHDLLEEFKILRSKNLEFLVSKNLNNEDLQKKGQHPELGEVSLQQLLATWVVHDLNHISQIARVLAKQYKNDVGPWVQYLRILQ